VDGLRLRKIGMQPQAVAGLEIWHRGNRQRDTCSSDTGLYLGTDQVEASVGCCLAASHTSGEDRDQEDCGAADWLPPGTSRDVCPQAANVHHSMMLDALRRSDVSL